MDTAEEALPHFQYHPDPIGTGNFKISDQACICCGKARGFVYVASVYGPRDLRGSLCPWCIANGAAASKFNCFFAISDLLEQAEVPRGTIIAVTRRTPGFSSWQQQAWQVCCDDACVFRGDATRAELAELSGDGLLMVQREWHMSPSRWDRFLQNYVPGGDMSVFCFDCLHCGKTRYVLDLS